MTETETLVERFIEELPNRGNLDAADELFAQDFVWHVPYSPEPQRGPEAVKQTYAAFRTASPTCGSRLTS
jgi:ketosteroid isomerase-like protein